VAFGCLEQLGYQAEAATWRNAFLMGAFELRNGVPRILATQTASPDTVRAMTPDMVLDYMAMRLDARKAAGKEIAVNLVFPDIKKRYALRVRNSVRLHRMTSNFPKPTRRSPYRGQSWRKSNSARRPWTRKVPPDASQSPGGGRRCPTCSICWSASIRCLTLLRLECRNKRWRLGGEIRSLSVGRLVTAIPN